MIEMSREESIAFLAAQEVGHLAVIDDGEPYVSPISYVVTGDTLYFRTRPGRRLTALRANPRLCVEASATEEEAGTWTSVCVWGDAVVVADPHREADVVSALLEKYADSSESILSYARGSVFGGQAAVVEVPIDTVTGRQSGRELGAQIRPGRL
jgi:nitroimidazol reductase NimA-like FMN-containing flavoprotein (pyridoxamine 5'-phosphate oxidase superfamily)